MPLARRGVRLVHVHEPVIPRVLHARARRFHETEGELTRYKGYNLVMLLSH